MGIKHYFGAFGGRLAGVPGWTGGHFYTANSRLQGKIENHPYFAAEMIYEIGDERSTDVDLPTEVPWDGYVKSLSWGELRDLAKDKGVSCFGKKAVDLIEELIELGG